MQLGGMAEGNNNAELGPKREQRTAAQRASPRSRARAVSGSSLNDPEKRETGDLRFDRGRL